MEIKPVCLEHHKYNAPDTEATVSLHLVKTREEEGRCPKCGLKTHNVIHKRFRKIKKPLTIDGRVLDGRCLLCNPLTTSNIQPQQKKSNPIPIPTQNPPAGTSAQHYEPQISRSMPPIGRQDQSSPASPLIQSFPHQKVPVSSGQFPQSSDETACHIKNFPQASSPSKSQQPVFHGISSLHSEMNQSSISSESTYAKPESYTKIEKMVNEFSPLPKKVCDNHSNVVSINEEAEVDKGNDSFDRPQAQPSAPPLNEEEIVPSSSAPKFEIKDVIENMNSYAHSEKVQMKACKWIGHHVNFDNNNKKDACDLGAIPVILEAIKNHPENAEVNWNACHALKSLALHCSKNQDIICKAGGVSAIIGAMEKHPDAVKVQWNGCDALSALAESCGSTCSFGQASGILSMLHHINETNRIKDDCATEQENKICIVKAGGIPTIINAMKKHSKSAKVQEKACRALYFLSENEKYRDDIAKDNGITAILDAMKNHQMKIYSLVLWYACWTLENLSQSASIFELLQKEQPRPILEFAAKTMSIYDREELHMRLIERL